MAAAIESWWEFHAQNEEAAALILSGNVATARHHAERASQLADQYDDFQGFSFPVTPPAAQRFPASIAAESDVEPVESPIVV